MTTAIAEQVQDMTFEEAVQITAEVREAYDDIRYKLLDVYERNGWKAMGYHSFKGYLQEEYNGSWQHGYTLVSAAETDLQLEAVTGTKYVLPVNQAKALNKLDTGEQKAEAYALAKNQCAAQGEDVTAKAIMQAVDVVQRRERVRKSPFKVVVQMMSTDKLSAHVAEDFCKRLQIMTPDSQLFVQRMMTEHQLQNADLAARIGERFRKRGYESKIIQLINQTGAINDVPLSQATIKDWKEANNEASQNHKAEKEEEKRQKQKANNDPVQEPKLLTLYTHSPERTARIIINALKADDSIQDIKDVTHLLQFYIANMEHIQ